MATEMIVDFSDFNKALVRLYKMGDVRKIDIAQVFSNATIPLKTAASTGAGRSYGGVQYSRLKSRLHSPGTLGRSIKFKMSKEQRLVYYLLSTAWYEHIVIIGSKGGELGKVRKRGGGYYFPKPKPKAAFFPGIGWMKKWKGFKGKDFMAKAISSTEAAVKNRIEQGLFKLIGKEWERGS